MTVHTVSVLCNGVKLAFVGLQSADENRGKLLISVGTRVGV